MKVEEVIRQLQEFPEGTEVCVFDWRKNIHHANDEPQGFGIHPDFKIEHHSEDTTIPFIGLSFKNDDYNDDGTPDLGSSIVNSIQ